MSVQGLLYRGHYWFYCSGCGHPTISQCCGQLQPWHPDTHGNLPNAIQRAHQGGHQLGYTSSYGGYGGYNDFFGALGTLEVIDGIADGDPLEVMEGMALQQGNVGEAMVFGMMDDRDRRDDGYGDDGGFFNF